MLGSVRLSKVQKGLKESVVIDDLVYRPKNGHRLFDPTAIKLLSGWTMNFIVE